MSIQRYQLKNRKLDKMSFHLLYISTSRYEGDWHSTPHAHHCTELFYVSSGKGSFLVNDDVFDVKADDLIIVNPNVMHTEMSRDESPLEYIVLGIEDCSLPALRITWSMRITVSIIIMSSSMRSCFI